jgi:hypothetical protein
VCGEQHQEVIPPFVECDSGSPLSGYPFAKRTIADASSKLQVAKTKKMRLGVGRATEAGLPLNGSPLAEENLLFVPEHGPVLPALMLFPALSVFYQALSGSLQCSAVLCPRSLTGLR